MVCSAILFDMQVLSSLYFGIVNVCYNCFPVGDEMVRSEQIRDIKEVTIKDIARRLVQRRTNTLGLIIPDITNPFYPGVARGVEDGAASWLPNI